MTKAAKPKKVRRPKPRTIMDAVDALLADPNADIGYLTDSQTKVVEQMVQAKRKAKETT